MLPADERLHTDQGVVLQGKEGLVGEEELALLNRLSQLDGQLVAFLRVVTES